MLSIYHNKGADQLCDYREADLRLCFRICKKPVVSQRGSNCGTSFTQEEKQFINSETCGE